MGVPACPQPATSGCSCLQHGPFRPFSQSQPAKARVLAEVHVRLCKLSRGLFCGSWARAACSGDTQVRCGGIASGGNLLLTGRVADCISPDDTQAGCEEGQTNVAPDTQNVQSDFYKFARRILYMCRGRNLQEEPCQKSYYM